MVDIHFKTPSFETLDSLQVQALAVPFFEDERPLQGVAGLVDWRMLGMISRRLVAEHVQGQFAERVLVPSRRRFSFEQIFLFGAGTRAQFDAARYAELVTVMLETLAQADVRTSAIVLPGRSLERIPAAEAMECFLDVASKGSSQSETTLIDSTEAIRDMLQVLERARRIERAQKISQLV